MAVEILARIDFRHPLDLLVRSEPEIKRRYRLEDWFIREIVDRGRAIYEAPDEGMGRKSRTRLAVRGNGVPLAKGAKL